MEGGEKYSWAFKPPYYVSHFSCQCCIGSDRFPRVVHPIGVDRTIPSALLGDSLMHTCWGFLSSASIHEKLAAFSHASKLLREAIGIAFSADHHGRLAWLDLI